MPICSLYLLLSFYMAHEYGGNGNDAKGKPDWTDSYNFWSKWEDTDQPTSAMAGETTNTRNIDRDEASSFMGHDHDHSVERKLLELTERDKMSFCESHRRKGNYLFLESIFPKAAEQYQLALSYYEYCFPDDDETQIMLDTLRRACLCNISLCYYRMGHWRMALSSASQVIAEDENNTKALFRRAQAYRALDEYSCAELDIIKASRLSPGDRGIQREIQALQLQKKSAHLAERDMALTMLTETCHDNSNATHEDESSVSATATVSNSRNLIRANGDQSRPFNNLFSIAMPLEPCIPKLAR